MRLHLLLSFTLSLISISLFAQAKEATKQLFSIGERLEYHSNILNQDRFINVYLPHGYSPDSAKTYPVIYLLDGSKDEDFIHIAGLVQFASYPWINLIQESIVVGIENIDRYHDFTYPTELAEYKEINPTSGGSEDFMKFIESELQPYIESAYKVEDDKTIIGQSLGGLLAAEILAKKPDMFDKYIIVSPSLWWDDESLLDMEFASYTESKSVYITVGAEGKVMKKVAKNLYKKLKKSDNPTTHLEHKYMKDKDHGDALHLGVYNAFEAMKLIEVEI